MRILILGGYGYLGSNIAYYLKNLDSNYYIATIDHLVTPDKKYNNIFDLTLSRSVISYFDIQLNLKNLDSFDIIINCTNTLTETLSDDYVSNIEPVDEFSLHRINCICQMCEKHNIKLINLSTFKLYNWDETIKEIDENININYLNLEQFGYWIKEEFVNKFSNNLFNITLRLTTPYGGQFTERDCSFIKKCYMKELKQLQIFSMDPYIITSSKNQERDYIHIKDISNIIHKIIQNIDKVPDNSVYNVCTSINTKLEEIPKLFKYFDYEFDKYYENSNTYFPIISNKKILSLIGEYNFIKLEDGIKDYYLEEERNKNK